MAQLAPTPYPMPDSFYDPANPNNDPQSIELKKLMEVSDSLDDDSIVGGVINFPRGDGYAYYLVLTSRPLVVQWIPIGDNWQVEPELIAGLTRESIRTRLASARSIRNMFSSNASTAGA